MDIEILAKGRGMSFARNIRKIESKEDGVYLEVYGEPEECLLGILPGEDGSRFPLLCFPDGKGEIALDFETQDENGEWHRYDIRSI